MLRFAEKNIDKIVINFLNKRIDNLPRKIQVRSLFCIRNISNLDSANVEYFTPTAQLTSFQ